MYAQVGLVGGGLAVGFGAWALALAAATLLPGATPENFWFWPVVAFAVVAVAGVMARRAMWEDEALTLYVVGENVGFVGTGIVLVALNWFVL